MPRSFTIHPSTRIAVWVILVVHTFSATQKDLFILAVLAAAGLVASGREIFFRQISRMRWILVSLFAIYSLSTPGDPLLPLLGMGSPTWQGIDSGALQAVRILLAVAFLAVLQGCTSREKMLSGLHSLLVPFGVFGIDVERIAVRLMLTMRYAEEGRGGSFQERMNSAFANTEHPSTTLTIDLHSFGIFDGIAVFSLFLLISL